MLLYIHFAEPIVAHKAAEDIDLRQCSENTRK